MPQRSQERSRLQFKGPGFDSLHSFGCNFKSRTRVRYGTRQLEEEFICNRFSLSPLFFHGHVFWHKVVHAAAKNLLPTEKRPWRSHLITWCVEWAQHHIYIDGNGDMVFSRTSPISYVLIGNCKYDKVKRSMITSLNVLYHEPSHCHRVFCNNFIMQDDNALPHRARNITRYLAMSPVINHIEDISDRMDRQLCGLLNAPRNCSTTSLTI